MPRRKKSEQEYSLKQRGNGVWYVHPVRISTWTKDEQIARQFLDQYTAGTKVQEKPQSILVKDILNGYAKERENVRSSVTMLGNIKTLNRHLGNLLPEHLLTEIIRDYARKRKAETVSERKPNGVSNATILREIDMLRAGLHWARDEAHWVKAVPLIKSPVKPPAPRKRWLKKTEAKILIDECKEFHLLTFVLIGLYTGARSTAIVELQWSVNIDMDLKIIDFGEGHGNKLRSIVPMHPDLYDHLVKARQITISDFVVEYNGEPVKRLKRSFKKACERAGLKNVSPHILRHTAATWMALGGMPIAKIARFLNITEEVAERRYAKFHPDFLKDEVMALSFREE